MQLEHRLSALLQLHLHSQLNTWVQWIGQQQLQDETTDIKVLGFGAAFIRDLTVCKHTKTSTKWQPAADDIFKCILLNKNNIIICAEP